MTKLEKLNLIKAVERQEGIRIISVSCTNEWDGSIQVLCKVEGMEGDQLYKIAITDIKDIEAATVKVKEVVKKETINKGYKINTQAEFKEDFRKHWNTVTSCEDFDGNKRDEKLMLLDALVDDGYISSLKGRAFRIRINEGRL